jgi:hypothetical protein
METPNTVALTRQLRVLGMDEPGIERVFQTFNVADFQRVRADG